MRYLKIQRIHVLFCAFSAQLEGCVTAWLGRALEWHSRGQRFDPAYLHQHKSLENTTFSRLFFFHKRHKATGIFRLCPSQLYPLAILFFEKSLHSRLVFAKCEPGLYMPFSRLHPHSNKQYPVGPMDMDNTASSKLHIVHQECRQFLLTAKDDPSRKPPRPGRGRGGSPRVWKRHK